MFQETGRNDDYLTTEDIEQIFESYEKGPEVEFLINSGKFRFKKRTYTMEEAFFFAQSVCDMLLGTHIELPVEALADKKKFLRNIRSKVAIAQPRFIEKLKTEGL